MHLRLPIALTVAFVALTGPVASQDRRVPTAAEIKLSFAPIVQRVAPTVVNVYAAKVVENRNPLFDDPLFRRFFGSPDMPRERVQRSLGSGVIVDPSGLVVTNNHVIEGASEVKVALADKREFEAEMVLKDARTDLAVLRIRDGRERFPAIELGDSDDLQVGDIVLAIGNPFAVGQTVTQGIVSALARTQVGITDYQFFIQTDAAITRAIPAARWSTSAAGWPASIQRSTRARAVPSASALPSRRTWSRSWSPRPAAAAAPSGGPGSAPSCRPSRRNSPKTWVSIDRRVR